MEKMKTCKTCDVEKLIGDFRQNSRVCLRCQHEKNKLYMKSYYQQHKQRLLLENSANYYTKNPNRRPNGRPRKWLPEIEFIKKAVFLIF